MATTASIIGGRSAWEPFYYLKITGLPYYWFCTIDPTATKYGSNKWTLPAGYTAILGMHLPDMGIEQSLDDIVGGLASPESITLELSDTFAGDTTIGKHRLLSKLFSSGRVLTNQSIKVATLNEDVAADDVEDDTFQVVGVGFPVGSSGANGTVVYIGGETIGYKTRTEAAGKTTFTIDANGRNRWPCHASYPPVPYYRTPKGLDGTVIPSRAIPVTSEPLTIIGRTAALYVGHMRSHEVPEAENQATCRLIGRIGALRYNARGPGKYSITIDSVMADLDRAKCAPDLGVASIANQICLAGPEWRSFVISGKKFNLTTKVGSSFDTVITVNRVTGDGNVYNGIADLIGQINAALKTAFATAASNPTPFEAYIAITSNGERRVAFRGTALQSVSGDIYDHTFTIKRGQPAKKSSPPVIGASLLSVLGFSEDQGEWKTDDADAQGVIGNAQIIVAQRSPPSVFIPTHSVVSNTFGLMGKDQPARKFFINQGDGTGYAWVRFGDGQIVRITATESSDSPSVEKLTTTQRIDGSGPGSTWADAYYWVPESTIGMVEQVVVSPITNGSSSIAVLWQLLCSTTSQANDGEFNVFPEGVGLGFNGIVDKESIRNFRANPGVARRFVIDKESVFKEYFEPIAKSYNVFLVWNPEDEKIEVRPLRAPSAFNAHSLAIDESNRADKDEATKASWDKKHVRTGWIIRGGWDYKTRKFTLPDAPYTDSWAMAAYGVSNKVEKIEDKSITGRMNTGPEDLLVGIAKRSSFFRHPWVRCNRTLDHRGLLLAPGRFHLIADNTIPNPFTGGDKIIAGDAIYALLTSVSANFARGEVEVEFLLNGLDPDSQKCTWAPAALIDFDANTGGFTNGYNNGTKQLKFKKHYTGVAGSVYDGIDFAVGNTVRVLSRDNDGAPSYDTERTIDAVAADGLTVTLNSVIAALSTTVESYMTIQPYDTAVAADQLAHAFLGDSGDNLILGTARNKKYS